MREVSDQRSISPKKHLTPTAFISKIYMIWIAGGQARAPGGCLFAGD